MARKFFIGGNWKSNGTVAKNAELVKILNTATISPDVDVVIAPTFVHIPAVLASVQKDIKVSAQNCWVKAGGAYTGEIAAEQLVDLGLEWVILGHSERRHIIKESDAETAEKTKYALSQGLSVILCIGELLEERESGETGAVNARQLQAVVDAGVTDWSKIVVAYEPVWAIGTGKVATPEQAQETHKEIRAWIAANVSPEAGEATRIIYGGSVNGKNAANLGSEPDIDGFLVGGASLKPEFLDIIAAAPKA